MFSEKTAFVISFFLQFFDFGITPIGKSVKSAKKWATGHHKIRRYSRERRLTKSRKHERSEYTTHALLLCHSLCGHLGRDLVQRTDACSGGRRSPARAERALYTAASPRRPAITEPQKAPRHCTFLQSSPSVPKILCRDLFSILATFY